MIDDLERRIGDLELAVLALAVEEFGDLPGHPFRGNQHTGGGGGTREEPQDPMHYDAPDPAAYAKAMKILDQLDREKMPDSFGPNHRPGLPDLNSTNGVTDARNMDRAQKLINYEKMHGTEAMLGKMTPAERQAHLDAPDMKPGTGPFPARPAVAGRGTWMLNSETEEFGDTPGHPFHGNQWSTESVAGGDVKVGDHIVNPNTGNPHEVVKVERPSRSRKEDPYGQWSMLHVKDGGQTRKVEVHNGDVLEHAVP